MTTTTKHQRGEKQRSSSHPPPQRKRRKRFAGMIVMLLASMLLLLLLFLRNLGRMHDGVFAAGHRGGAGRLSSSVEDDGGDDRHHPKDEEDVIVQGIILQHQQYRHRMVPANHRPMATKATATSTTTIHINYPAKEEGTYEDDDGSSSNFWLNRRDVPNMIDFYAAAWWMPVHHFLNINTTSSGIPQYEGAVFSALRGREHLLRQSLDYLDYSVEHLSTWWRVAGVPHNPASYQFATNVLSRYVHHSLLRLEKPVHLLRQEREQKRRNNYSFYSNSSFVRYDNGSVLESSDDYNGIVAEKKKNQIPNGSHPSEEERLLVRASPLGQTVAVLAFSQIRSSRTTTQETMTDKDGNRTRRKWEDRDHNLTLWSLAATAVSLVRAGVGRIVVVGSDPTDPLVVNAAFRLLTGNDNINDSENDNGNGKDDENYNAKDGREEEEQERNGQVVLARVGGTDLTFVPVSGDLVRSARKKNNVPRAALAGLQMAFRKSESYKSESDNEDWTRRWLGGGKGTRDYWKYVYYTEADSILQTRSTSLPRIHTALNSGLVLVPHRLQLIPYEGDIPDFVLHQSAEESSGNGYRLVPVTFKTPILLYSSDVSHGTNGKGRIAKDEMNGSNARSLSIYRHCCDAQMGDYKPGTVGLKIRTLWWRQGFSRAAGRLGDHSRLLPYEFIRLSDGTGITTIAGTNQGRRCIPSTAPCVRRAPNDPTKRAL